MSNLNCLLKFIGILLLLLDERLLFYLELYYSHTCLKCLLVPKPIKLHQVKHFRNPNDTEIHIGRSWYTILLQRLLKTGVGRYHFGTDDIPRKV
jgi:hypothetical protein